MIIENLRILRDKIDRKCAETGRNPSEICLIAVSKTFGVKEILEANNGGINNFGENKAQELTAKYNEIKNKVTWHFIGNLQRNKVRFVVEAAEFIHSVDSLLLAAEINKRAQKLNKVQKILIQVKTSDEETKSGITDQSEVYDLVKYCREFSNIELTGLMTIAPFTDNKEIIRNSFRELSDLKKRLNNDGFSLKELSMGMTSDFEIAIEEGATILRIGSAIFGERNYQTNLKEI